jgi:hypothetical protein
MKNTTKNLNHDRSVPLENRNKYPPQIQFYSAYLINYKASIYISMALQPFVGPWSPFQFLNPTHSRKDSLDGGSARRKAATYTHNKRTQTSMPWVRFESTIPAFKRAKTVHATDRAATVIGRKFLEGRKCRLIQVRTGSLREGTEENHITSVRVAGAPDEIGRVHPRYTCTQLPLRQQSCFKTSEILSDYTALYSRS